MRLAVSCFLCTVLAAPAATAQIYPSRLVRIIVPLTPGGSNDVVARAAAEKLSAILGRPFVVENRPGASGNIGTELVAKSAPDGHTLLMANTSHVINPSLFAKLPYDPIADFAPIARMTSVHFALVVHPSVPAQSAKEFIAFARTKTARLTYASAGNGSPHHLSMELLKSMAGVELTHVPYKGAGQFIPDLVSGEVSSVIGAINSLLPHVKAGRLRVLAMAGTRRTPLLPEVPTIAETYPDFEMTQWYGLFAPPAIPEAVLARLRAEVSRILKEPEIRERLHNAGGVEAWITTPGEFATAIRNDHAKYARLVREIGARID